MADTGISLQIGQVKLENRLILAPVAGMVRLSLRKAYRRVGAAMTCVGIIDARAVAESSSGKLFNILGREERIDKSAQPVSVQLTGAHSAYLAEAAERIAEQADIIDLNFSCPTRRLVEAGCGAAWLSRTPLEIERAVAAVVKRVQVPVTAKIRVGICGNDIDVLRIARGCEAAGAAAIVVHARTVRQRYHGPPCWEWIRRVKQAIEIPVIANGCVYSPNDARELQTRTQCDFIMIGTAAFIHPMIFRHSQHLLTTGEQIPIREWLDLVNFFHHYYLAAQEIDGYGPKKFFLRSVPNFLRMRTYMQRIQKGIITIP